MESDRVVLIVDDDYDQRAILRALCERAEAGIFVEEAASVDEAFRFLELHNCDLILADVRMPGGSGAELILTVSKMARERALPSPRVVLTTAGECEEVLLNGSAVPCCSKRQLLRRLPDLLQEQKPGVL